MNRFYMTSAFIEMIVWTAVVPYLIWEQWGMWPALALLTWWLLGYWRVTIVGLWKYRKWTKALRRHMQEAADMPPLDPKSQALHNWLDDSDDAEYIA